jgi:hypothetical protein
VASGHSVSAGLYSISVGSGRGSGDSSRAA